MSPTTRRMRVAGIVLALSGLLMSAACTSGSAAKQADGSTPASAVTSTTTSVAPVPQSTFAMSPASGTADMSPATPIVITSTDALTAVTVLNPEGTPVAGALSADSLTWTSAEPLGYAKTYTATAAATNKDGVAAQFSGQVTTVKPDNLTHASISPGADGAFGVGTPIIVRFDEKVTDKAAALKQMAVTTTPQVAGSWYWFNSQEVHWRPQGYWAPGTRVDVAVNVYGVQVSPGLYGQDNSAVSFSIGDSVISKIDNGDLQLRVYQNGQLVKTMPASMGMSKYPTQSGIHVVQEKYTMKIMDSSTWGLPTDAPGGYRTDVPYATRISGSGEFVHSAPWSVGDQGRRNVSHGCINVSYDNGVWFYNISKFGDVVEVTGTPATLQMGDAYMDWNIDWATWSAGGDV